MFAKACLAHQYGCWRLKEANRSRTLVVKFNPTWKQPIEHFGHGVRTLSPKGSIGAYAQSRGYAKKQTIRNKIWVEVIGAQIVQSPDVFELFTKP